MRMQTRTRRTAGFAALAIGGVLLAIVALNAATAFDGRFALGTLTRGIAGAAFLWIGIRFLTTDAQPEGPSATKGGGTTGDAGARAKGPVSSSIVDSVSPPVSACMVCGAPRMRALTLSDGLAAGGGELLRWVCDRCGAQGQPLRFEDRDAYRDFVRALHEDAATRVRVDEAA